MQIKIPPYLIFLNVFFLLFSCKEKEKALDSNKQEKLAERIISTDDINQYQRLKNDFLHLPNDSLKNTLISDISYAFYKKGDSLKFREWNKYFYNSSKTRSNQSGIAASYWDLANYFYQENFIDSSYFYYNLSSNHYLEANEKQKAGKMLLNMAILQEKVKDYIGSENTTFQALGLIEDTPNNQNYIYSANNNLGIIYNGLGEYSEALTYHLKALKISENLNDPINSGRSLNNLGVVFQKLENHSKAIDSYKKALSIDSIFYKNTKLYAMLSDNLGYSELKLGNNETASFLLHKALKIRDSIGHESGIIINKLHLGEYYLLGGDTTQALRYIKKARLLAAETQNNRDLLASNQLLAKIEPQNAQTYLNSYITLNDSLLREERAVRNKFARIRFETDQFIEKANTLNQQKTYLTVGILLVLLLFFLSYIIQRQNSRNKKLVLKKQQQDSNERIYDLLLRSQQKFEEGSSSERKRISRELHDSILSKFFGIRLNLEVLNNKKDKYAEKKRTQYLESLKSIENEIRGISHKLNIDEDFSDTGFIDILNELFAEFENTEKLQVIFSNSPELNWGSIKNNIKINFYRIMQEALHNIRKHATNATVVEINIELAKDSLILKIRDDGEGFDVRRRDKGIGIKNINERIQELKGEFDIESSTKGTKLKISIPKELI
ncbi:tetratricopeptide repeat-containing sensor histidine kinase [Salegentibacter sp. UBA1130]|uniref:tetratricopeptide repeat-containing sensor histidine kinase n=1 Tax=Salegentibacter sp. UBA1130 TaxID=1947451 RepID=UPI00257DA1E7|nr:tetratricopeptide repeat protein [Salegentibacter sp. UBA1130]